MTQRPPVTDWTTDFDVLDPAYIEDPFSIWDELRKTCPIAHTGRRGGAWLLTTYADVTKVAHDIERFSSLEVGVIAGDGSDESREEHLPYGLPPISSDPPLHTWTRRLLLPWFSHSRVDGYESITRDLCQRLIEEFIGSGHADAAADYAQQIPVRVIAKILGVPEDLSDTFTGWVRDVLEFADEPDRVRRGGVGIFTWLHEQLQLRKEEPQDDLISQLVHTSHDDMPIEDSLVLGIAGLVLIAGIDTTWSAIGSTLWHLARNPQDTARLVAEPDLLATAVEEFLRVYSPVTMARVVTADAVFDGCPMEAGDKVLLNFPAANRDPAAFERADEVVLDRAVNRHIAFGTGIHRCAGSNLARMELRVALEEWLTRIPTFHMANDAEVTWAGGQVRGPRSIPVVFP